MFLPFEIHHRDDGPWGQTTVEWKKAQFDSFPPKLVFQGHAEVTTCDIGVRLVQYGASVQTTTYLFLTEFSYFRPIPPLTNLCGIVLRHRCRKQTNVLRPRRDELLTLHIRQEDIIIQADDGRIIREVHRVPLKSIASLIAEALLPAEPEPVPLPVVPLALPTPAPRPMP